MYNMCMKICMLQFKFYLYFFQVGLSKSNSKREVYSDIGLPQEIRKISNKQPELRPKETRKRRENENQSQQKKRNNTDQKKTNETETKNNRKY